MIRFIKKWFFPPSFSFMFYSCLIGIWFLAIPEWNRSWENFLNHLVSMAVIFSIFYLAMDGEDGRFTSFHEWLKFQNKWIRRLVVTVIFLLYFISIAVVSHYFPHKSLWSNELIRTKRCKSWSCQIFQTAIENEIFFDTLQFSFVWLEMKKYSAATRGGIITVSYFENLPLITLNC